jgi:hypothetical protein
MGTNIKENHERMYQCIFPTTTRQEQIPTKLNNLKIRANLELCEILKLLVFPNSHLYQKV